MLLRYSLKISFFFCSTVIILFFLSIFFEALPFITNNNIFTIFSIHWDGEESFGFLPAIWGTFIVSIIALTISIPISLALAIFISQYLNHKIRIYLKILIELIASVPGVVYGLLGILIYSEYVKSSFNLNDGYGLFTAGLVLSIMITPLIVSLSDDVFSDIPASFKKQGESLGLLKSEIISYIVFPFSIKSIIPIIFLSLTRAIGETIAIMLVIGSIDRLPSPLYNIFSSGQTISSKLGRTAQEAYSNGIEWNALMFLALVLSILVVIMMFLGIKYNEKLYKNKYL